MNFHFDLGVCVHTSADLHPTVHMSLQELQNTPLRSCLSHDSHTPPEAVPAHTQPESFHISIGTKRAVFPFSVMPPSPPAVLFNKSLSAHLLSTYVRMCIYACAAGS